MYSNYRFLRMFGITFGKARERFEEGRGVKIWHTVCLADASFHSVGAHHHMMGDYQSNSVHSLF